MAVIEKTLGYVVLNTTLGKFFCPVFKLNEFGNINIDPAPTGLVVEGSVACGVTYPTDYPTTEPSGGHVAFGTPAFKIIGKSGTRYDVDVSDASGGRAPIKYNGNIHLAWGGASTNATFGADYDSRNKTAGCTVLAFCTVDGTRYKLVGINAYCFLTGSFNRWAPYAISLPTSDHFGYVTFVSTGQGSLGVYGLSPDNVDGAILDMIQGGKYFGPDQYGPGGYTNPDGEEGPNPDAEWELPEDELAVGGSVYSDLSAGLYRAYAMTQSQLRTFSDQLWGFNVLSDIREAVENPTNVIIGLFSYPFDVSHDTDEDIGFNWINHWVSSGITGGPISQEIQHLEFGYIHVPRFSGCFYDYQPFSTMQLHLPYIGFVPLKMSECIGRNIYIDYYVSVITGDFTAHISVDGERGEDGIPLIATFQGNIAKALPMSQQSLFEVYKRGFETGVAALTMAGSAYLGGAAAFKAQETESRIAELSVGSKAWKAERAVLKEQQGEVTRNYRAFRRGGSQLVNNICSIGEGTGSVSRNGSVDGMSGRTSPQECFAIFQFPDQDVPENQQRVLGYPSNIPGPLSKVTGYVEVRDIQVRSSIATEGEITEIEEIVRGGILI